MPRLHVLRVFCSDDGSGGNLLGVFLDAAGVDEPERQRVAADLGFSETVFVDDAGTGSTRIHTPEMELGFAGHPSVGTAWLLARERSPVGALRLTDGEVPVRYEGQLTFVSARPEWGPQYEFAELASPAEVEALDGPPADHDLIGAWAWADEEEGVVRARVFPRALGIAEDEATGSAAVGLTHRLGRALDIRQGRGSRILAAPVADGMIEIGGFVVVDEVREHPPAPG